MKKGKRNLLQKSIIILFWLALWQFAAYFVDNTILLTGPVQVAEVFWENLRTPDFLKIIFYSFGKIGLGFFLAFLCGVVLGALSYRFVFLDEILAPVMLTLKSIPVASFVVLLLIWFGSARLSFFISFLIVFPNVYVNTNAGLQSTDARLLEMADIFEIRGWNRFCYIYRPSLMPYLSSCLKISLGMSWKSGVAAEVIGMPEFSLGERLYMSKIYLDTAGLFAWTVTIILLSFLFEKVVLYLLKRFEDWKPYPVAEWMNKRSMPAAESVHEEKICICHLWKAYGENQILQDFSLTMEKGKRYCLMAPSGRGKTTLLRLLAGLEQADGGRLSGIAGQPAMVFQEDRLCEDYDVITNIMLTAKQKNPKRMDWFRKEASQILPAECLGQPVKELSGGMKRRCAVLRAVLSDADIILMDEPFTGLDEENRQKTAQYILERLEGRTLLVATHQQSDVELLKGSKVEWQGTEETKETESAVCKDMTAERQGY